MIYVTHGTVACHDENRISHALMLPEPLLMRHLESRCEKYVPLAEAIQGKGDAFTVDDASRAGLRAVLLARQYGHAACWFVNGAHLATSMDYFPFLISWMLDETRKHQCVFDGARWDLTDNAGRRRLRLRTKELYMKMKSYAQIRDLLGKLSGCLNTETSALDPSLQTVTAAEVAQAVAAGVELGNHCWTHLNPRNFSPRALAFDLELNGEFLSGFCDFDSRTFAPPYGNPVSLPDGSADFMLLANKNPMPFHSRCRTINRRELKIADLVERTQPKMDMTTSFECIAKVQPDVPVFL